MRTIAILAAAALNMNMALAYIDPGTGGTIIGNSLWPFLAGIFAIIGGFFARYFRRIKRGITRIWRKH